MLSPKSRSFLGFFKVAGYVLMQEQCRNSASIMQKKWKKSAGIVQEKRIMIRE
jgi:hypothetical protein